MLKKLSVLPLVLTSSALFAEGQEQVVVEQQGGFMQTLIMIGIAILFFYFILWRPEQKRRKAMEAQRSAMKKGDKITAMGIIGTLVKVSPESPTVIVKMYDGSKIELLKAAISEVHPATEEEAKKAEKEDVASAE
jgi:preprotein translocase subunit YajC